MSESTKRPTRAFQPPAEREPRAPEPAPVLGLFTYRPATDEWTWSDGMYRIHGFEPHEVVPTSGLVLSHIHPADRDAALASREANIAHHEPFTFQHRIIDAKERERIVIAAGHVEEDADGLLVIGHVVDLTEFRDGAINAELDQAVADFAAHRAVIEQAKGVLMQLLSVDADTAWQMLRAYSLNHNRKVRDLAVILVQAATTDSTPRKRQTQLDLEQILRQLDS